MGNQSDILQSLSFWEECKSLKSPRLYNDVQWCGSAPIESCYTIVCQSK